MRPEARWHDGQPITVDDVIYSLDLLKTKGHPQLRFYYQSVVTAERVGPRKVRFNSIRPGFIATEIMEGIPRDSATYRSYIENTPMEDVGTPEDVGHLARFLIGPESRWITGTAINCDGGHHLRRGPDFGPFIEPGLGPDVMRGRRPRS